MKERGQIISLRKEHIMYLKTLHLFTSTLLLIAGCTQPSQQPEGGSAPTPTTDMRPPLDRVPEGIDKLAQQKRALLDCQLTARSYEDCPLPDAPGKFCCPLEYPHCSCYALGWMARTDESYPCGTNACDVISHDAEPFLTESGCWGISQGDDYCWLTDQDIDMGGSPDMNPALPDAFEIFIPAPQEIEYLLTSRPKTCRDICQSADLTCVSEAPGSARYDGGHELDLQGCDELPARSIIVQGADMSSTLESISCQCI